MNMIGLRCRERHSVPTPAPRPNKPAHPESMPETAMKRSNDEHVFVNKDSSLRRRIFAPSVSLVESDKSRSISENEEKTLVDQGRRWWTGTDVYPVVPIGILIALILVGLIMAYTTKHFSQVSSIIPAFIHDPLIPQFTFGSSIGRLDSIIYLNTTEGVTMLKKTDVEYSMDYFRVQQVSDVQLNQAYCAVASVVAVLNSLKDLLLLSKEEFWPYSYLVQENIFNECTNQNSVYYDEDKDWDGVSTMPYGMNLGQTAAMLRCYLPEANWTTTTHYVDPSLSNVEEMRSLMTRALVNPHARLIINFHRGTLGQSGRGHWSPVVGYTGKRMDAFLIMDVAKYKSPPFWVPASRLFDSMATKDLCGIWNYPHSQLELPKDLRWPRHSEQSEKAREAVGCQSSFRGFIIVEPKIDDDANPGVGTRPR